MAFIKLFSCCCTDAVAQSGGTYAAGTGPIWGSNVVCTGEEGRLVDCGFNSDTSSCTHSNDAGVTCNVTGEQEVDLSHNNIMTLTFNLLFLMHVL